MKTIEELYEDYRVAMAKADASVLKEIIEATDEDDSPLASAIRYGALGTVDILSGRSKEAIVNLEKARSLFIAMSHDEGVAGNAVSLGRMYAMIGEFPIALEVFRRGLASLEHEHVDEREGYRAGILAGIGTIHAQTGDYPGALDFYNRARVVFDKGSYKSGLAALVANMGNIQILMGDADAAMKSFKKSLELHRNLGDRRGELMCLGNIGRLHSSHGQRDEALQYLNEALDGHIKDGDVESQAALYGTLADYWIKQGDLVKAREALQTMVDLEIRNPAVFLHRMALTAQLEDLDGNAESAVSIMRDALGKAEAFNLKEQQASIHKRLREYAQEQNDFASYIKHNDAYTAITEEMTGKEASLKIAMQDKNQELEAIEREREKERAVLYSTLPKHVADRVIRGEDVSGDHFDDASVIFLDVAGFTQKSHDMDARDTALLLAKIFEQFDAICNRHNVTKVKTIGDAYLAVALEPHAGTRGQLSTQKLASRTAVEMLNSSFVWPDGSPLSFRIGIHSGPVVAGVLGTSRLQYDVWGDTVNMASRMESSGEANRIQVSTEYADALQPDLDASEGTLTERGTIEVKGKGAVTTYWLDRT